MRQSKTIQRSVFLSQPMAGAFRHASSQRPLLSVSFYPSRRLGPFGTGRSSPKGVEQEVSIPAAGWGLSAHHRRQHSHRRHLVSIPAAGWGLSAHHRRQHSHRRHLVSIPAAGWGLSAHHRRQHSHRRHLVSIPAAGWGLSAHHRRQHSHRRHLVSIPADGWGLSAPHFSFMALAILVSIPADGWGLSAPSLVRVVDGEKFLSQPTAGVFRHVGGFPQALAFGFYPSRRLGSFGTAPLTTF